MRKLSLIIVTLSLLAIAGGASAYGQVPDGVEANIPFSFTVGKMTLPAGNYVIKPPNSISEGILEIRSADGHKERFFLTEEAQTKRAPRQTELVFNRIGDQYFLSEIFEKGNNVGVEVQKSKAEKRLEKEGARIQIESVILPAQNVVNAGS